MPRIYAHSNLCASDAFRAELRNDDQRVIPFRMASIQRKIREARKRLNLKQGELAERLGVSQGTISRWETGGQAPDFQTLMRLAELAAVDPWYFAREEEHWFAKNDDVPACKVVAHIEQGVWTDAPEWELSDQFTVKIPIPDKWKSIPVKGYVIADNSAAPYYLAGDVVFVTPYRNDVRPDHADEVLIVREDDRGLFETTLKEYYVNHEGHVYLSGLAEDPSMHSSLRLHSEGLLDIVTVVPASCIKGFVFASFKMKDIPYVRG